MQKTIIYGAGIVAALGPVMGTFGRITSLAGGATRGIGNIAMAMGQNAASAPKWAQVVAVPFKRLGAGVKGAAGSVKGFATASKGGAAGARIMAAGQALLNASLFACPIVWVVAAIAGLVIALVVAYKKSETFRQMVDKAWQMLKRATTVVFAAVVRVIKMAIDRIRQNFMRISAVVSAVIGFFGRLYTGVVDKISAVVTYCKSIPEKIKSAIGDLSRTLYDKGASLIRGFGDGIESMINWLKEKARRVADVVKDIIRSVASGKSAGGDIRSGGVPGGINRFVPAGVDRSSSLLQQISPNRLQAGGAPLATPGGVVINRGAVQITFDGGSGLETSDVERVVTKALSKLSAEIVRRG
jgi:phage-related protein